MGLFNFFFFFQALLPEHYQYTVCEYSSTAEGICAVLRLYVTTEAGARTWIKEFEEKTKTTLRTRWKHTPTGYKNVFQVNLGCHHNTRPRSKTADSRRGSKNTNCPANMNVVVKRTDTKRKSK